MNSFDMWKGWLFLEESSAEILIRDYFIEWFVKPLKNKLRTFSARSKSEIIPKFNDFNNLFVFLHLEPTYKNKVWVTIDGGEDEKLIIEKLKTTYSKSGWNQDNFSQFNEHDFEKYYPAYFQTEVDKILALKDREKWKAKKALLEGIKNWIREDPERAKREFQISAKEVIEHLKGIDRQLK
ncbi:MAG: hypothetical protein HYZ42_08325 [Bacteroidetes bacterium]|nr:hypothetical protein [Bacteroidota bacterium]